METTRLRSLVLAAALALVAVASACNGSSTGSSSGSSSSTTSGGTSSSNAAVAVENQFEHVVRTVSPQVVQIQTNQGLGSGVVFDSNGDIVTNNHVVQGVKNVTVTLSDGKQFKGTVRGTFPPNDVAVVRVQNPSGLTPATFADSSKLRVGEIVFAIGNPLGLQSSVTNGIISALARTVTEPGGAALPDTIQTSAPINPGNSGGALVNLESQVVGIPTLAATNPELGGSAAPGIGFAIPSNTVKDLAGQIVEHGKVVNSHRAYLGVLLSPLLPAGVGIAKVTPGGPAAKAGVPAGSVLVEVDGQTVQSVGDVSTILAQHKPGDTVTITVRLPNGSQKTFKVKLGQFPGG
jgi:putative serine protease PepD